MEYRSSVVWCLSSVCPMPISRSRNMAECACARKKVGDISATGHPLIRSTSCLVLWYGFRGRWTKWRYFQLNQYNMAAGHHLGKFSNDHISATVHPIHLVFGSRVGFSGSSDRMIYFRFNQIQEAATHHFGISDICRLMGYPVSWILCRIVCIQYIHITC